jgi:hypothetical protein
MKTKNLVLVLIALAYAGISQAQLDANDYLQALEAEAATEAPAEHQTTSSELVNNAPSTPAVDQFIAFKNEQEFENYLSKNMRGTWMFFNKLDKAGKQLVFSNYQKKRQLGQVSHLVQQVYKMTR